MPRPRFTRLEPNKQAAILDAAIHEFAAYGFEQASYNRIIETAGVSKGAMYYYFDDKADLYTTVVRHVADTTLTAFGESIQAECPEDFWASVENLMDQVMELLQENPEHLGILKSALELHQSGAVSAVASEIHRAYVTWTEQFITCGQQTGAIRTDLPHGLLVALLTSMAVSGDMWVAEHLDEMTEQDARQLARQLTDLMRSGLVKEPDPA